MTKVGFIGTGVMGKAMATHILKAGYPLFVYNRTKEKALELIKAGATWCNTPAEVAQHAEVILTIVGYPSDVREVYYGEAGIFSSVKPDTILIDLTTSTPTLAKEIYQTAKENSCFALDAPVSGGDLGAKRGTLSTMAGGDKEVFQKALPIFETFSKTIKLQGTTGSGQHTKMANQIMIAGTMTGLVEMLAYADKSGLNLSDVLETVGGGSAGNWSLENYGPRILKGDYSPGFFVKHFLKDLSIALDEAEKMNLDLPCTKLARKLYQDLCDEGYQNDGTQALMRLYSTI
ncbi:3-hydroxyisobutyrate dehydrogenase [Granulicatella balaenopterae]|uniref:3-hydroxyisobutyrate dehydrogenase n=1 Tax=Granulicatella balaenopterae TaxID=137733 RepID=A0A1H9IEC3_9LACT|nr:NAD(P)-dependent oxidoreductase [Granulicatella balaenopterae]SEQ72868.1 3-hydroxyisobutyrate dehydrogenase [Granulicatella balaenopterae]